MTDKIAYFDCFSGASGNMLLGALLDAGLHFEILSAEIAKLGLTGYHLHVERKIKRGISGTFFDVHDEGVKAAAAHAQQHPPNSEL